MSYSNPLHTPVGSTQRSGYSTLSGAMPLQAVDPNASHRKRLPQAPYSPASKWHGTTGRANALQPPIIFDVKGHSRQGISMRELAARAIHDLMCMLAGGGDRVFAQSGLKKITFRIMWPGYTEWVRSIDIAANGPITRAQLAQIISQNFSRFIEMHRSSKCAAPEWAIGPNGIEFQHLRLISLNNVFEDSWQADVVVDFL